MKTKIIVILYIILLLNTVSAQKDSNNSTEELLIKPYTDCGFNDGMDERLKRIMEIKKYKSYFIIRHYNQQAVETYRNENPKIYRFARIINDFDQILSINLYNPESPEYGVYNTVELEPGKEIYLWDKEYSIGNDWGLQIVFDYTKISPILFTGDVSTLNQDEYIIYLDRIISGDFYLGNS